MIASTALALAPATRTLSVVATVARKPRIRKHHCCAWCGRFAHPDGKPHGPNVREQSQRDGRTSHGTCVECFVKLVGRLPRRFAPIVVPLSVAEIAGSDAPGGDLMAAN
ncbi:MAG TPA: hypothetical protein VFH17_08010 [Coriobacteriia bacterium]|nr:hypothetical protein [Coriobacteriia bacterium]